jgi:hypothetical protein
MMKSNALIRDENSQAVINTDIVALNKYKSERALHRRVASLTKELVQVKQCLNRLNERIDKIENN